jgi:hypothetical protein
VDRLLAEGQDVPAAGHLNLSGRVAAAEHPDHVWALGYQFDQTEDGRS